MSETEAEVIRDLAFEAARPERLEPGKRYAFRQPDGTVNEIDLSADMPSRKVGYVTVTDVASFAGYYSVKRRLVLILAAGFAVGAPAGWWLAGREQRRVRAEADAAAGRLPA